MKAFRSDGSRWFSATTIEVMDRWLEDDQLIDWLGRTVEFRPELLGVFPEEELNAADALAADQKLLDAAFGDLLEEIFRPVRGPLFDSNQLTPWLASTLRKPN